MIMLEVTMGVIPSSIRVPLDDEQKTLNITGSKQK